MNGTATAVSRIRQNPWMMRGLVVLIVLAMGAIGWTQRSDAASKRPVPVSAKFEGKSGIRITRVSVVGDSGLVDVRFVVLDPQKAHGYLGDKFNGQTKGTKAVEPPTMKSVQRQKVLKDVASMHQHQDYVSGQTYYLLYLNPDGAIKKGDTLEMVGSSVKENLDSLPVE